MNMGWIMNKLLTSDNLYLSSIKDSDLDIIEGWFNDVGFLRHYDMIPAVPYSSKGVKELIEGFEGSSERYIFAIRDKSSHSIIGVAGFDEIIWSNGVATLFIGIGDGNYTGRGLGREALGLLLQFGFDEFNFYRIQLNVISYNEAAIRLYEGTGFTREGTFREFINRDGRRYDMYLYGLLSSEWTTK